VETVTAVLILLGLRWLPRRVEFFDPRRTSLRARARRARDITLAVLCGIGVAPLSYAVLTRPAAGDLGPFFIRNALEPGGGRNVVNVILVDFRGFDALGEITVVAIVAMTVYALLRRFRPAPESISTPIARQRPGQSEALIPSPDALLPPGDVKIPAVLVRLLLPIAGLVSVYFLLRGHQAPGGGFVGGLVMATAVIAQYMVGGTIWVESRLRVHPLTSIALGLLAAAGAGILAWPSSLPFLTARAVDLHLPVLGEIHLSTVLLFDLGVYLLVIGATLLLLVGLAHQSLRSPRQTVTPLAGDSEAQTTLPTTELS
jgi:multicomponent K+:H+ antiporter subunit A